MKRNDFRQARRKSTAADQPFLDALHAKLFPAKLATSAEAFPCPSPRKTEGQIGKSHEATTKQPVESHCIEACTQNRTHFFSQDPPAAPAAAFRSINQAAKEFV